MSAATVRGLFACPTRLVAASSRRAFSQSPRTRAAGDRVRIVEVGPRDGLQNEKKSIPAATKIELIQRLARTGLSTVEAGSFVHPKWVPQMAASDQVLKAILDDPPSSPHPITYQWLLPNSKGLDNFLRIAGNAAPDPQYQSSTPTPGLTSANDTGPALNTSSSDPNAMPSTTSGVESMQHNERATSHTAPPSSATSNVPPRHEISIFLAATETFSQKNTNCSIADSLTRSAPLITAARTAGFPVRAYISVALGCPFEGPAVNSHTVADMAATLLEAGADQISIADTTGMGTAPTTRRLLATLRAAGVQPSDCAMHFHDTFAQALVNTMVALDADIRVFDSAVAGLGGCPYSPGATGNVATEDLVHFLHSLGVDTGVDLEAVSRIGEWISGEIGRENASSVGRATLARLRRDESRL